MSNKEKLLMYINDTLDKVYTCDTKTRELLPAEHRLAIITSWLVCLSNDIIAGEYDATTNSGEMV